MKLILSLLVMLFASSAQASPVTGYWTGTATRGGETTPITIHVEEGPGGLRARYDIPALSLEGMPMSRFAFDPATGAITGRTFQGQLNGIRITGQISPALLHGGPATVVLEQASETPSPVASEREVEFVTRGHRIRGRLVSPRRDGNGIGLVSLHGSGPSTRWLALARARRFAEAGYSMLIFDKPGSGESEGDWTMTSLDDMAADALAAADFLAAQPEVTTGKVGLWGHSQAGWIISRVSAMSDRIAFAMVLAGGGSTPRDVERYGYMGALRHANASPAAVEAAMAWVDQYLAYEASGQGYDAVVARLTAEPEAEWVRALGVGTVYPTPEQQPKWSWVATYEPATDIRKMRIPVLLLFAEDDENTPTSESLSLWRRNLAEGGNADVEWKMFADADHHFLTPAHPDGWPAMSPGYYETQIDWLNRKVRGR